MTNRYDIRIHIGCGGHLNFEKEVVNFLLLNHRMFGLPKEYKTEEQLFSMLTNKVGKAYFGKAKVKSVTKNLYRCNKCNDLINVITCPSWEQLVLMGRIKVPFHILQNIKHNRKNGALRY